MGTRLDATDTEQRIYMESIYEFSNVVVYRSLRPWLYDPFVWILHPMYWQEHKLVKNMHSFTSKIINQRKNEFYGGTSIRNKTENAEICNKQKSSMLDLLLSSTEEGLGIDEKGIREEVDTFTFEVGYTCCLISVAYFSSFYIMRFREKL